MVYRPPEDHKRILTIDGGGIRGIIPVLSLIRFEELAGMPCYEFFDMMAGSSIGAIVAALLSTGKTAEEVFQLIEDHYQQLFQRRSVISGLFNPPKYSKTYVRRLANDHLGDRTLADCTTDILITAKDTVAGETIFFSCFQHDSGDVYGTYKDCLLRKVVEASMSAPLYFRPLGRFIDGGVGGYNNTSLVAPIEAICYSHDDIESIRYKPNELTVYSFGTGKSIKNLRPGEAENLPGLDLSGWAQWIIGEGMDDANQQQVDLIGSRSLIRRELNFPAELKRFDLSFTENNMEKIGIANVDESVLRSLSLDSIDQYELLKKIGMQFADYIAQQSPPFSQSTTDELVPRTSPQYREEIKQIMS